MRIKEEFERRTYGYGGGYSIGGTYPTLEGADKNKVHHNQVAWEEIEELMKGKLVSYTHIIHYRDNEHYNDLYFI